MNFNPGLEQLQNDFVNWGGITLYGAFKLQPLAHGHDRHAVPAQIATDQNHVAGPDALRRDF